MSITSTPSPLETSDPDLGKSKDEDHEKQPTQAISGKNIDGAKLKTLLRIKFGAGAYEIQVRTIN